MDFRLILAICKCGRAVHVRRLPLFCECGQVVTQGHEPLSPSPGIITHVGTPLPRPLFHPRGVGAHLTSLINDLDRWGSYSRWIPGLRPFRLVKPEGCQGCEAHAAEMDTNGIPWCQDNVPTILQWLKEGAEQAGVPFFPLIARLLIRTAIHLAQQDADRAEQSAKSPTNLSLEPHPQR